MKTLALLFAFFRFGGLDFASMGAGLTGGLMGMQNADELPNANFNIPGAGMGADAQLYQAMTTMTNAALRNLGLVDPQLQAAYMSMLGIDRSGIAPAGMEAGGQYGDLASLSQLFSGMLGGQAQGDIAQQNALRQAGGQTYQAGQDPQNQLHDYMRQQAVDASRAATSARGIGMGANAAGLENDATRNFEMNWQNQQLGRQLAGLQGMTGANQAANQTGAMAGMDLQGSMGFGAQAPGFTMASAMAPVQAQQTAFQLPMDWANLFSQAEAQNVLGQQQGVMNSIYPYLGMAAQGQQAQYNAYMGHDIQRNNMQQQSQYGMWGGGQSGTNTMQGNQSGAGNPMNWMGMMG